MKFQIDKEKCVGCGTCVQISDGGTKLSKDMKAEIVDNDKIEKAGGESVCPFGAIIKTKSTKVREENK
ncbi:4Fe-4S binding protein [Patescibacteria group bacterium]|nr:4Fe-4S binding protein [Patescibacteria group bacterium]MBU4023454.1 4Fe-4S binding protein [Patescibacteria group bacterium]MBU4078048.1 4Fe-4S binding protein [Patescibacteria group bacterium]